MLILALEVTDLSQGKRGKDRGWNEDNGLASQGPTRLREATTRQIAEVMVFVGELSDANAASFLAKVLIPFLFFCAEVRFIWTRWIDREAARSPHPPCTSNILDIYQTM